jgi:cephalosporin hydroxylase
MKTSFCFLLHFFWSVGAVTLQYLRAGSLKNASSRAAAPTFPEYVETVTAGRGIWKWNNALVAYERHLTRFKQQPVKLAEIGVWSGGSLLMWHSVLGAQCHVYGLDIAKNAFKFQDKKTTIAMLDQGDPAAWANFFQKVTPSLNVLIDDGAHASSTMLTTTTSAWAHISPGGVLAIEDINGAFHLEGFLTPAAQFYGGPGHSTLNSLHLYPLVLIAEKGSPTAAAVVDPSAVPGATVSATVATMEELTTALSSAAPGSLVVLENPTWGSTFLTTIALTNFFHYFIGMYAPVEVLDVPKGCAATNTAKCTYSLVNSPQQDQITAVHILPAKLVVEVAASKPVIQAVRHGTEWVSYPTGKA